MDLFSSRLFGDSSKLLNNKPFVDAASKIKDAFNYVSNQISQSASGTPSTNTSITNNAIDTSSDESSASAPLSLNNDNDHKGRSYNHKSTGDYSYYNEYGSLIPDTDKGEVDLWKQYIDQDSGYSPDFVKWTEDTQDNSQYPSTMDFINAYEDLSGQSYQGDINFVNQDGSAGGSFTGQEPEEVVKDIPYYLTKAGDNLVDYIGKQARARFIDPETGRVYTKTDPITGEEYLDFGNLDFGISPVHVTGDQTRSAYEDLIRDQRNSRARYDENGNLASPNETLGVSLAEGQDKGISAVNLDVPYNIQVTLDDGYTPGSEYGVYMTGEQYIYYREHGMPGRDIDDIDPNGIYNKQLESVNHGFIPYVTEESYDKFDMDASAQDLSDFWSTLGQARNEFFEFDVNYNGNTYNGNELMRELNTYKRRIYDKWNNDPDSFTTDPAEANEFSVPYVIEYTIDIEGQDEPDVIRGRMIDPERTGLLSDDPATNPYWPYRRMVAFEGVDDPYLFLDDDDLRNSMDYIYDENVLDGEEPNIWFNAPPLEFDNGQKLSWLELQDLMGNEDGSLDAHNLIGKSDFGWGNLGKPRELIDEIPAIGDLIPFTADMLGQSSQFLLAGPTNYVSYALSNAPQAYITANSGIDPSSYDLGDGTYRRISEHVTPEQINTTTAGYLLQPLGESFMGPIGGKALFNFAKNFKHPLAKFAVNAAEEGFEEIFPGDIFEQMIQNGMSEVYANPILDEDLEPMFDAQGHPIVDPDTVPLDRMFNYMSNWPAAGFGGAYLGGLMSAPSLAYDLKHYDKNSIYDNDEYKKVRRKNHYYDFSDEAKEILGEG